MNKILRRIVFLVAFTASSLCVVQGARQSDRSGPGEGGIPHYCKTDGGVLGPYPNDGRVKVGDPCFGTDSSGRQHYGTAVMSKGNGNNEDTDNTGDSDDTASQGSIPHYCKTDGGVLGPYPNDGRVKVGDPCFGTDSSGRQHYGTAVMSKSNQ